MKAAQAVTDIAAAAQAPAGAVPHPVMAQGFFDRLKELLNPSKIAAKLHLSKDMLIDMILYLAVGFLVGFILKRFGTYIFVLALCIVGLIVLQQIGVISVVISWTKIHQLFGIQPASVLDSSTLTMYWDWVKVNMALVLSFSVGFLIGLKLG